MINYKKLEEHVVEEHRKIYFFVLSKLKDEHAADDVTQTIVLKALSNVGSLKDVKAFKSWLMSIAVNEIKLYIRSLVRYKKRFTDELGVNEEQDMDVYAVVEEVESDILLHLVKKEEQINVMRAMDLLDEKYELIIRFYIFCDFNLIEIAEMMEININTVRTRYARGLKLLRTEYERIEKGAGIA